MATERHKFVACHAWEGILAQPQEPSMVVEQQVLDHMLHERVPWSLVLLL